MPEKGEKQLYKSTELKEKIEDFFYSDSVASTVTKFVLMSLALGGIVFVGALIPSFFKATSSYNNYKGREKYSEKKIKNSLANLKRRKLIEIIQEKNGKTKVRLTNKGMKRVLELSIDQIRINKPKKWDKKWRIVIFDIPIKYNKAREALRHKIKELGFKQLQKSVWVYPYECEDEILFVAKIFNIEKYIEILTVERLLHQKEVAKTFNI